MDDVVTALKKLDNLEELYEVRESIDIVTLLSAADIEEFRDVLKNKIMKIKGVKSTVSFGRTHVAQGSADATMTNARKSLRVSRRLSQRIFGDGDHRRKEPWDN